MGLFKWLRRRRIAALKVRLAGEQARLDFASRAYKPGTRIYPEPVVEEMLDATIAIARITQKLANLEADTPPAARRGEE